MYAELSFAFHDNLSKDGVSVNIPLVWVLNIKFIVICYFTTSDIRCGELWFRIWMAEVFHSVIYDIIQRGGDAGKITMGAKMLKLEKGILLDNYVWRGPRLVDAQARSLLIYSKRSKRHISLEKRKKCGSFDRWYIPQVLFWFPID